MATKKANPLNGKVLVDLANVSPVAKEFRHGEGDTPEWVKPKDAGPDLVFAEVDMINFNSRGKKTSMPYVMVVNDRTWEFARKHLLQQGYNYIRLLHAPVDCNAALKLTEYQYKVMTTPGEDGETEFVFGAKPEIVLPGKKKHVTRKAKKRAEKASNPAQ